MTSGVGFSLKTVYSLKNKVITISWVTNLGAIGEQLF